MKLDKETMDSTPTTITYAGSARSAASTLRLAREVLANAQADAVKLEQETRQRAAATIRRARKRFQENSRKQLARQKIQQTLNQASTLQNRYDELLEKAQQEILELTLQLTRQLLLEDSENRTQALRAQIEKALSGIRSTATLRVRASEHDQQLLSSILANEIKTSSSALVYDSSLPAGEALIEVAGGLVRISLPIALAQLEKSLKNINVG